MGRKKSPGLFKRKGIWHIDKHVFGRRICQSTGYAELEKAEAFLAKIVEDQRQAIVFGVRPQRTFEQAAAKFVLENQHKRSLFSDVDRLKNLMPWIGDHYIDKIHVGTLQPWIDFRRKQGRKASTINHGLKVVRRILNLAALEWIDENGLTWLLVAPKIKLLPVTDMRKPYPLSWEEQDLMIRALPKHLAKMALFAANTGCRDNEICSLRWEWEVKIPELNTTAFIIPEKYVKNGDERLVVLNQVALSVVGEQRGTHSTHVFHYKDEPIKRMLNSAWMRARSAVDLEQVRVHDLKHTFGRRLRAAGVSFEDRQDLLGHRSGRITTHYSAAELSSLIEAANKVCDRGEGRPELVVLRRINYG
jgi:integrase